MITEKIESEKEKERQLEIKKMEELKLRQIELNKKMEEEKCNFWRDHPVNYLKMAFRYDKQERIENADGYRRNEIDS